MENKLTEATALRPEGERMLNAKLVEIDLNEYITKLKQETTWAESDRNSITVFKSDTSTIVLIGMHENAKLKEHSAIGNITVQVLDGEIEFFVQQQIHSMGKGKMIALEANIPHSVTALKESFFLLTLVINR